MCTDPVRRLLVLEHVQRFLLCSLVLLAGCEARLGGGAGSVDVDGPDAGTIVVSDAPPLLDALPMVVADNACGVASTLGDLGLLAGIAGSVVQSGTTADRISWVQAPLPGTAMQATPDLLMVELWDGFGVFGGGVARAGTFTLTGAETDYDTCGVCVLLAANVANNTPAKLLLATSGTVTITSVGSAIGQTTRATLDNATFVEIVLDPNTGYEPVSGSSCPSPLSRGELSGTL